MSKGSKDLKKASTASDLNVKIVAYNNDTSWSAPKRSSRQQLKPLRKESFDSTYVLVFDDKKGSKDHLILTSARHREKKANRKRVQGRFLANAAVDASEADEHAAIEAEPRMSLV